MWRGNWFFIINDGEFERLIGVWVGGVGMECWDLFFFVIIRCYI